MRPGLSPGHFQEDPAPSSQRVGQGRGQPETVTTRGPLYPGEATRPPWGARTSPKERTETSGQLRCQAQLGLTLVFTGEGSRSQSWPSAPPTALGRGTKPWGASGRWGEQPPAADGSDATTSVTWGHGRSRASPEPLPLPQETGPGTDLPGQQSKQKARPRAASTLALPLGQDAEDFGG